MKFLVSCKENGLTKSFKVDDEHRWGHVVDMKVGQELDGEKILGDAFKGYTLRITGGTDENGFPMKLGVVQKRRVRLLVKPGSCALRRGREGERKRRSVRGAIVDRDIGALHYTIINKGEKEVEGLTDKKTPRRLGPKRANKIRKLFGLPRHSDRIGHKEKESLKVDKFDVCRYVVKRPTKTKGDKSYYKAPKIQRLITAERVKRKRNFRKAKIESVKATTEIYNEYVVNLKKNAEERKKKEAEAQAAAAAQTKDIKVAPKATPAPKDAKVAPKDAKAAPKDAKAAPKTTPAPKDAKTTPAPKDTKAAPKDAKTAAPAKTTPAPKETKPAPAPAKDAKPKTDKPKDKK